MSDDKLRAGQRGIIQRFPGTAGDFRPTDQDADVEGHRAAPTVETPEPDGGPQPARVRDTEGDDDVEGHLYRPGGERGE